MCLHRKFCGEAILVLLLNPELEEDSFQLNSVYSKIVMVTQCADRALHELVAGSANSVGRLISQ
jgi:hypothetical protein